MIKHVNPNYRVNIIEQVNWRDGDIIFYGWMTEKDIFKLSCGTTVAIFRIKYKTIA